VPALLRLHHAMQKIITFVPAHTDLPPIPHCEWPHDLPRTWLPIDLNGFMVTT
jgi:hypothetical protein